MTEAFIWCAKMYVLVSDEEITAEQVLSDLPEPEVWANIGVYKSSVELE